MRRALAVLAALAAFAGVIVPAALEPSVPSVAVPRDVSSAEMLLQHNTISVRDVPGAIGAVPERHYGLAEDTLEWCDQRPPRSERLRAVRVQSFFTVEGFDFVSEEIVAYRSDAAAIEALTEAELVKASCDGRRAGGAAAHVSFVRPPAGVLEGSVSLLLHGRTSETSGTRRASYRPGDPVGPSDTWSSSVFQRRGRVLAAVYASGTAARQVQRETARMAVAAARGLDALPSLGS